MNIEQENIPDLQAQNNHVDWVAAGAFGVDLHQLAYLQSLTPEQRIQRHESARQLVIALRNAGLEKHADTAGTAEPNP